MELLIVYLALVVMPTKVTKYIYKTNVMREIAKRGFKFVSYDDFNKSPYKDLIPGYIISVIKSLRDFKNNKECVIEDFIYSGQITEMTDDEKIEYICEDPDFVLTLINTTETNANKTVKGATLNKKVKEHTIEIDEENLITYQVNPLNVGTPYRIVSTTGEMVESLSTHEQYIILVEYYEYILSKTEEHINEFYKGNKEKFEEDILLDKFDLDSFKSELTKEYGRILANKLLK